MKFFVDATILFYILPKLQMIVVVFPSIVELLASS